MDKTKRFTLRFGIGDPDGLQSGIWRAWADPGKSDVYVAIRTIAGDWKISLHESGDCNASITEQAVSRFNDAYIQNGGSRHLDKWKRQVLTGPLLSIPMRIRFPQSELRPCVETLSKKKEVHWIPSPPPGHSVDVVCMFTSQKTETEDWPWRSNGGGFLASTKLQNGETFWLISRIYPTPPSVVRLIEQQRKRAGLPIGTRLLIGGEIGPGNIPIITDAASRPCPPAP